MTKDAIHVVAIAAVFLACASAPVEAESIGLLNDTGQAHCYTEGFQAEPCAEENTGDSSPLPRQDGRYGRDAFAAAGRLAKKGGGEGGFDFTRVCMSGKDEGEGHCLPSPPLPEDVEHPAQHEWACVRDNVTGLTWTLGNWDRASWAEASTEDEGGYIHRANASARCGLSSGWRLPGRREGFSLFHLHRERPGVDPTYFPILSHPDHFHRAVWTSDVDAGVPVLQHVIQFNGNNLGGGQCRDLVPVQPCGTYPPGVTRWEATVLLVNGDWRRPPPPKEKRAGSERWQIRDDGLVVTDMATGLMWDRCAWGQSGSGCDGDAEIFHAWRDAMAAPLVANTLRHKGYYDWRMPSARELETLVKIDAVDPAIDTDVFPNTPLSPSWSYFWTATSYDFVPGLAPAAFVVDFADGALANFDKPGNPQQYPDLCPIRLVRGGHHTGAFDGVSETLWFADFEVASARTD